MFVESIHFKRTLVTIYRKVLERNTLKWTSCDWVCTVNVIVLLTFSHGFIVLLSFLLWLGIELSSNFRRLWNQSKCEQRNHLPWHLWMMFEWLSDLPFHYSWVGILLWWMLSFNSTPLNTVVLEFINVKLGLDVNLWIGSFRIVNIQ